MQAWCRVTTLPACEHPRGQSHYKQKFRDAGLLDNCGGELQHLISDAATMQIIRWTGGGFGMAAHNYDGDMLTDQIAQMHRSPGFINSCLTGKAEDGKPIRECVWRVACGVCRAPCTAVRVYRGCLVALHASRDTDIEWQVRGITRHSGRLVACSLAR